MMRSAPVFLAASASYATNLALGSAVAARLIDTGGFRWVHHAVYVLTVVLTVAALSTALGDAASRRRAIALAPVVVPLAVMPHAPARSGWHVAVALAAAPFYASAVLVGEG